MSVVKSGTTFSFNAIANTDKRELYQHFSCGIDEYPDFKSFILPKFRFDSIIPNGQAFFEYIDYYRWHYARFCDMDVVIKLDNKLSGYNNNIIRDGIKAIAFLFFCKFGASYLEEAVYALAYWLSQLRNEYSIFTKYIGHPIANTGKWYFQEATSYLDRFTTPSQYLSWLLDSTKDYPIENIKRSGGYWDALRGFLEDIEKTSEALRQFRKSNLLETRSK